MKFLKKLRSSNFWVSMISAVVLIIQAVFDVTIKAEYLNQIIMAMLGLLVMSGIISDGSSTELTIGQSVDVEGVKTDLNEMLSKTATSIEEVILNIVNQFKTIKTDEHQGVAEVVCADSKVETHQSESVSSEACLTVKDVGSIAQVQEDENNDLNATQQADNSQNKDDAMDQNVDVRESLVDVVNPNIQSQDSIQPNFDTL